MEQEQIRCIVGALSVVDPSSDGTHDLRGVGGPFAMCDAFRSRGIHVRYFI